MSEALPSMSRLLPIRNEVRWSDMLATLIDTDPTIMEARLGLRSGISAHREVRGKASKRRPDIIIRDHTGASICVIEDKVLAPLSGDQLADYEAEYPSASHYLLVTPERLPIWLPAGSPWQQVTWEDLLADHARSSHSWVRATAQSWLDHIDHAIPHVSADTVWNDVHPARAGAVIDLDVRITWLGRAMQRWSTLHVGWGASSENSNTILTPYTEAVSDDLWVSVELEEGLNGAEWPKDGTPAPDAMKGPVAVIGLEQECAETDLFPWSLLAAVFADTVDFKATPSLGHGAWSTTRAQKTDNKPGWQEANDAGMPAQIGQGYQIGLRKERGQPRRVRRIYGARLWLPKTLTLRQIEETLHEIEGLVIEMRKSVLEHL